jgi:hypothetical protein
MTELSSCGGDPAVDAITDDDLEAGGLRPFPVPDWWRCLRLGPVSGRYEGDLGRQRLVLRVDIDPLAVDAPVMNRISADVLRRVVIALPFRPPITFTTYQESWIVDRPTVTWTRCSVTITGRVRYWRGTHPVTDVTVTIPWDTFRPAGPATVQLTAAGAAPQTFVCARTAASLRDLELEVDVCTSTNNEPVVPTYDTHGHANRPAGLRRRTLTIQQAYREAGVAVTVRPDRTIIDDSAPAHASWSVAELHDAMETHYGRYGSGWPAWRMWGLLAGRFDNTSVGGIMFDAKAAYGGAGEAPERQGFAVFRDHSWFNNLVTAPSTQAQHDAMRQYLYTWVHEAGHAFNLLHSWDKSRPDSLSWMNYAWRYDNRNGADTFWARSMLQFDEEELIHIRHGDRAAVIMGGDEWASGGHLESPFGVVESDDTGPIELLVRTHRYYGALEPVSVELRLRNRLPVEVPVDARLAPEHGNVLVEIRRPNGIVVQYSPVACTVGDPAIRVLAPTGVDDGSDRYSERVLLAYGSNGHLFAQPGEYLVRAFYTAGDQTLSVSNTARLRVGSPYDAEADRLAYELHSDQAGLALVLGGSRSTHLEEGMDVLERVSAAGGIAGAAAAAAIAPALLQPFHEVVIDEVHDSGESLGRRVERHGPEPDRLLALTAPGLKDLRDHGDRTTNLVYRELVTARAEAHVAEGDATKARSEVKRLRDDLEARGAKPVVLAEVADLRETIS